MDKTKTDSNNSSDPNEAIINETTQFVKDRLKNAESGHDWFHIQRVYNNSILIFNKFTTNNSNIDLLVIKLGALLHDIADHKFHNGNDKIGGEVAREFLENQSVDKTIIDKVCYIIDNISFKGSGNNTAKMESLEGQIVQDADRLDALGAIGVARAFSYGGYRNRSMYDPDEKPKLGMNWEEYKKHKGNTINHFYEKLLLVKDMMNTESGKELAQKRHDYMLDFIEKFMADWNGEEY